MPSVDDALAILSGAPPPPPAPADEPRPQAGVADRALSMLSASPDDLKAMMATAQAPDRPGLTTRALAGANTGLIAQTLGAPFDLTNAALNLVPRTINTVGEAIGHNPEIPLLPTGASETINRGLGKIGIGTAALPPAEGAGERIAEQVGQGAGAMMAPFGAARAGFLPAQAAKVFGAGPQNMAGATALQAGIGAASGLGGGVASEVAPDNLKPLANIAGQLVGGGLAAGAAGVGQGAWNYGAKKVQDFRMPSQVAKVGEEALSSGAIPKAGPGEPGDVATFFTDRLNAAENVADQHILQATQQAKEQASNLGAPRTAQDIGKEMQTVLNEAATREKTAASDLYKAVDPDGTLTVPAAPLREQVGAIQKDISPAAKPPSGEEAGIYDYVNNTGDSISFREAQDLRSRVSTAIRQEVQASGGESPELRRLSQIKAAIDDSLAQGAAEAAKADPAVATRLAEHAGTYSTVKVPFEADLARSYRSSPAVLKAATRSSDPLVQSVLRVGDTGNDTTASASFPQSRGGVRQGEGRPGNAAGGPQVPQGPQSLSEALDRYAYATQKYREYKDTYRSGPVGNVLKPGPSKDTFATPESAVPGKLTSTPEQLAAFEKAAGSRQQAVELVHDQLTSTIPKNADGSIDAARFTGWHEKTTKTGVFEAFPELEPRFTTAADASQAVVNANAERLLSQKARQKSAASLFTGGNDPVAAIGRAMTGSNAQANMRELWTAVKGKPEAEMGLKRAIIEHIRQKVGSQEEGGKGVIGNPTALRFLRANRAALREVFDEGHLDQMQKLATAFHGNGHGNDLVTAIVAGHVGEHLPGHIAEHATHGIIGKVIGVAKPFLALGAVIAKHSIEKMRASGITRVDQLWDEAMLNPRLARTMTERMTPQNSDRLLARFGNQMAALTAEAPQRASDRERGALDAVTRGVSSMAPGEAVTEKKLQGLSGRSDISGVRQRLVQRGLLNVQNGRYVRAETTNSSPALAPKETPQPKANVEPPGFENVYKAIQQRQPTLRRQSLRDLNSEIETRPSPYYGSYRPGGLVEHAAAVAQGTPLTHDVVHLLRRSGAIPRDEWSILTSKADGWAKRLGVEGPPAVRREEAIAQAYNHWRSGDMQLPPGLRRIMGGITALAERASA